MNAGKPTTKLAAHRDGVVKPCGKAHENVTLEVERAYEATPPRLLGRGLDGSAPGRLDIMNAGKPTTKLAAHRDGIVKPCGPEMQLQEPMLNQTGQQELQELKVKWKDAKMELDDERSARKA